MSLVKQLVLVAVLGGLGVAAYRYGWPLAARVAGSGGRAPRTGASRRGVRFQSDQGKAGRMSNRALEPIEPVYMRRLVEPIETAQ